MLRRYWKTQLLLVFQEEVWGRNLACRTQHSQTDAGSIILENEILVITGKESFASQNVVPLDVSREFKNTPQKIQVIALLPSQMEFTRFNETFSVVVAFYLLAKDSMRKVWVLNLSLSTYMSKMYTVDCWLRTDSLVARKKILTSWGSSIQPWPVFKILAEFQALIDLEWNYAQEIYPNSVLNLKTE